VNPLPLSMAAIVRARAVLPPGAADRFRFRASGDRVPATALCSRFRAQRISFPIDSDDADTFALNGES